MSATLLLAPARFAELAAGAVALDPDEPADRARAEAALAHAQARAEQTVGYRLLAHATELVLVPHVPTWLEAWPYVQTLPPSDEVALALAAGAALPSGQAVSIAGASSAPRRLRYVAGYRGRHHVLDLAVPPADAADTDLRRLEGLADLERLPPLVPPDIEQVLAEVAQLALKALSEGSLGKARRTQQLAGAQVAVEAIDPEAEERALRRLAPYRRLRA